MNIVSLIQEAGAHHNSCSYASIDVSWIS